MKKTLFKNQKTLLGILGLGLFVLFLLGLTMPEKVLPVGMANALGVKRRKVTRRYTTMPQLQQKMAQVGQQYAIQQGLRV